MQQNYFTTYEIKVFLEQNTDHYCQFSIMNDIVVNRNYATMQNYTRRHIGIVYGSTLFMYYNKNSRNIQ